jgi:hypothetical protein
MPSRNIAFFLNAPQSLVAGASPKTPIWGVYTASNLVHTPVSANSWIPRFGLRLNFAPNPNFLATPLLVHTPVSAISSIRHREFERQFFVLTIHQIAQFQERIFKNLLGRGTGEFTPLPI